MRKWPTLNSGPLRVVLLLGVLAGVLAMHALTVNHHAGMAVTEGRGAAVISPEPQSSHGSHHNGADAIPAWSRPTAVAATSLLTFLHGAEAGVVQFVPAEPASGMGDLCVAVLAGLVLLILPALRRGIPGSLGHGLLSGLRRTVLSGRSPPWSTPSLSKLCVLRI
jgi:hypothetical protein